MASRSNFVIDAAEVGSEDDEVYDEETGEVTAKVRKANGNVDDSSEEEDEDDDEEAAREVCKVVYAIFLTTCLTYYKGRKGIHSG